MIEKYLPEEDRRAYYVDERSGLKCFDEDGLTYIEEPESGLFYPNIISEESTLGLSKWGMLRMNYIKEHKPILWTELVLNSEVIRHCYEVEQEALELQQQMLNERMKPYRHLQSENYMEYLQTLNNMTSQVDETVANELVYV